MSEYSALASAAKFLQSESTYASRPLARSFVDQDGTQRFEALDPEYSHLNTPQEQEDDSSFIGDVFQGIGAGVEGFARSIVGLADAVAFDAIPDSWSEDRLIDRPEGIAGNLTSGIVQFGLGFVVPGLGLAGLAGKGLAAARLLKQGSTAMKVTKSFVAGGVSDFVSFDGQEKRLSNLLTQSDNPILNNAITQFLAAPDDDEEEIKGRLQKILAEFGGRLKNVGEGAAIGGIVGGSIGLFVKSLKQLKAARAFDGSEGAAKRLANATKEVEDEAVNAGLATPDGIEIVRNLQTTPSRPPALPQEQALGDVAGEAVEPVGGVQAILSAPQTIRELSGAESSEEVSKAINEVTQRLLESQKLTDLPAEDLFSEVRGMMEAMGLDVNNLDDYALLFKRNNADHINQLRFIHHKQHATYHAKFLAHQRLANATKKFESLTNANASADEIMKAEMEIVRVQAQLENIHRINSQIGSLLGQGLGFRRKSVLTKFFRGEGQEATTEIKVKREDIEDLERGRRNDQLVNKIRDVEEIQQAAKDDQDLVKALESDSPDVAAQVKSRTQSLEKNKTKLEELEAELDTLREKATDLKDSTGGKAPKPLTAPKEVDPRIVELQDKIKYYKKSIKQDEQLRDALDELDVLSRETPEQTAKRIASKPRKVSDPDPLQDQIKQLRSKNAKTIAERTAKDKDVLPIDKLTKDLENLRKKAAASPKATAKDGVQNKRILENDEARDLIERIKFYKDAFKDEKQLNSLIDEIDRIAKETSEETAARYRAKADAPVTPQSTLIKQKKKQLNALVKARLDDNAVALKASDIKSRKDFAAFLSENIGSQDMLTYAKRVNLAASKGNLEQELYNIEKYVQQSGFTKMLNGALQVFSGNILSGPPTFVINAATPVLAGMLKRLETAVGAALAGDKELLKATVTLHSNFDTIANAFKMGVASLKANEDVLFKGAQIFDDAVGGVGKHGQALAASTLGLKDDSLIGSVANTLNFLTNLPNRLNGSVDTINKTIQTYAYLSQHFTYEGITRGIKEGADLAKYVDTNVRKMFMDDGSLFSEERLAKSFAITTQKKGLDPTADPEAFSREYADFIAKNTPRNSAEMQTLARKAESYARDSTFTAEPGELTRLVNVAREKLPVTRFLLPFVNTPMNVLKFGLARTPFGVIKDLAPLMFSKTSKSRQAYEALGPIEKAAYRGRVATAVGLSSTLTYFLMNNRDVITGGGPRNFQEKKALEATGWRPYSFKFKGEDGTVTYVSYQRTDPFATMLGVFADMAETITLLPENDSSATEVIAASAYNILEGLTDRSFLKGLNNLINIAQDPETYIPKTSRDIISGLAVPMFVDKIKNTEAERMIRETKTLSDAILRKLPIAEERVAPKRTFLGEPVYVQNPLGLLGVANPIFVTSKKNDIVDKEISELLHGFSMPSENFINHSSTNMREFQNDTNQDAYDRFLELSSSVTINGKTMRQALQGLMKSRGYKQAKEAHLLAGESDVMKDPRVGAINRIMRAYRRKAKQQVGQEYPELKQVSDEILYKSRMIRRGINPNNPIPSF